MTYAALRTVRVPPRSSSVGSWTGRCRQLRGGGGGVEQKPSHPLVLGDVLGGVRCRHQDRRCRVPQHVGDAVRRIVVVDREVRGPGLEDGDLGDDQVGRAGEGQRDDALRTGTAGDQGVREPVGALVQLGVGEAFVLEDEGDVAGAAAYLFREHGGPGGGRDRVSGGVPLHDHAPVLVRCHQRQSADRGLGARGTVGQQGRVVAEKPVHGRIVEEVGAVVRPHSPAGLPAPDRPGPARR